MSMGSTDVKMADVKMADVLVLWFPIGLVWPVTFRSVSFVMVEW